MRMRNRVEIVAASYFQLRGEKNDDHVVSGFETGV